MRPQMLERTARRRTGLWTGSIAALQRRLPAFEVVPEGTSPRHRGVTITSDHTLRLLRGVLGKGRFR